MGDFVCTTPNQTRIFLPSFQKSEVKLRADIRYGPDDPMLWPQPWVDLYCHLGTIPRKPDDPNDRLSIMWWDPTLDDFKSSGGSLVDGLGELSGSKLLSLRSRMSNMEDRIEDHKRAFPNTNSLLLLLARAMQDAFARLHSLKTTLTEMRVGVAEFQRYYLELYGCLDYLKIYKPRMEGLKPPAEFVANCMGLSQMSLLQFRTSIWQVYLFGSSGLQQSGTALSDAIYWKLLPLSTLGMFCVFRSTTRPSLQFFTALRLIQKDTAHATPIHESGWYSRTHLGI